MIKIIPDFISIEAIDKLISSIDMSTAKDYPHQQFVKSVNGIVYPPVHHRAKQFGNISNIEFLSYRVGSKMYPHIDKYRYYEGNKEWCQTGILFMSDPSTYKGGELVFDNLGISLKCPIGTYIMFPAGPDTKKYTHSINEVTEGTRISLVLRYTKE